MACFLSLRFCILFAFPGREIAIDVDFIEVEREVNGWIFEILHDGIAGSEWQLFENSSHYAHAEEPEDYLSVLDDFCARVERRKLDNG